MKQRIYDILKARFLIENDAIKNWKFILFLVFLAMIMIANNHNFDAKNYQIAKLTEQMKDQRSKFVDTRSRLMKLKMESSITKKMKIRDILPADQPPVKIVVKNNSFKSFWKRLWE